LVVVGGVLSLWCVAWRAFCWSVCVPSSSPSVWLSSGLSVCHVLSVWLFSVLLVCECVCVSVCVCGVVCVLECVHVYKQKPHMAETEHQHNGKLRESVCVCVCVCVRWCVKKRRVCVWVCMSVCVSV